MTTEDIRAALRALAQESIGPVSGDYLRPWMCAHDPATARVLLVGANPATTFSTRSIRRDAYLDALVTDTQRLRDLYLELRDGRPSPTRLNSDRLVAQLATAGVGAVLETNVWTLPTPSLAALYRADRRVVARSTVLPDLVRLLRPCALIVHGAKATEGVAKLLDRPIATASNGEPGRWHDGDPVIVSIPSLSPPPANAWLPKAGPALASMADALATLVRASSAR